MSNFKFTLFTLLLTCVGIRSVVANDTSSAITEFYVVNNTDESIIVDAWYAKPEDIPNVLKGAYFGPLDIESELLEFNRREKISLKSKSGNTLVKLTLKPQSRYPFEAQLMKIKKSEKK